MEATTKTKRPYTRRVPLEPGAHKPRKPHGSGVVFEIWQSGPERTQREFAELLGINASYVRQLCRSGRPPRNVHARAVLLSLALAIPEPLRSEQLDAWIVEQQAAFEKRPAPGVFLYD